MFKIVVFVTPENAEQVKQAMFSAGAGKIGNYDQCCFVTEGIGQFRPLMGSNPTLGKQLELESVKELKIELVCEDQYVAATVAAMKRAHSYETPAYDVFKLWDL